MIFPKNRKTHLADAFGGQPDGDFASVQKKAKGKMTEAIVGPYRTVVEQAKKEETL